MVPLSGEIYILDRASGQTRPIGIGGYAEDPHFSPDARKIAFVRDGDLYTVDVETGATRRLTSDATEHVTNGLAEFVAQEEMGRYRGFFWSPDGRRIAYQRTDTTAVETLYSNDPSDPSAAPHAAAYPRAGRTNADVRLFIVSAEGGTPVEVDWDRGAYPYLATVAWSEPALAVVVQNRRQTEELVLTVDTANGRTTTVHTERDEAWINLDQDVPRFLDGDRFVWRTERDGEAVLELRSRSGAATAITPREIGLRDVISIGANTLWVTGSGSDATEQHVYRIPYGTSAGPPVRVTTEPGVHTAVVRGSIAIITSEGPQGPMQRVMRGENLAGTLPSVAEEPPSEPRPEFVRVGDAELAAVIIRPTSFDPAHRYPVLLNVYGGPHNQMVQRVNRRYLLQQWYADHGFIVVSIDGHGTPGRGRAFERAIARDVITRPLADQVAGLRALGERFPELDLERVGIYGWSFGGYFSAMAALNEPQVFRAAVAGAPVTDWRDYDTHYTERYMGLPDENREGYDRGSAIVHAARLERPLLLIHGTSDDNVYFTHSVKLSDALFRAGRDHEFLPLSGHTHMVSDPEVARALHGRILGFFDRHLRH
jgi:dipeptidyl-peptidase-4